MNFKGFLILTFLTLPLFAHAESMDLKTHNLLIEKLEAGKNQSPGKALDLRLADLYSDRARLRYLKEEDKNCQSCLGSKSDRKKALVLYKKIFSGLDPDEKERAFVQISQTYSVLGQSGKAISFHKKIIKGKYHKKLKALAYHAEGERIFFAGQYKHSLTQFQRATNRNSQLATPLTEYRKAWCEFNTGKYRKAKNHLARILQSGKKVDPQLKSDIARDFAKFTAKGTINDQSLKKVHALSPEKEAKTNVEILASELDRLGRPYENLRANRYILENFEIENIDSAFAYLRMSQAEQTLKRTSKTHTTFALSGQFFKKVNCEEDYKEPCEEYKKKARKFLVYWDRVEKDEPSESLLNVWNEYLKVFPEDFDMHYIAAQTFHKKKKYSVAVKYFVHSTKIIKDQKIVAKNKKVFVGGLDAAMGVAEESKSLELRRLAYKSYLEIYPKGPKSLQAQYQLAYLNYEEKKYDLAVKEFKNIIKIGTVTKRSKSNKVVAKKSADLVLDIYALKKDNKNIMTHSKTYAVAFPAHRDEYRAIYRKAILHEAVALLDVEGEEKYKKGILGKMVKIPFKNVPEKEQILLLETQVRLAKRLNDLNEMMRSSKKMLTYKKLGLKKSHFAYDNLIWASKVTLSFSQAYRYKKRQLNRSKRNKTEIAQLALLAELAGKSSHVHYEEYLDRSHGVLEGNRIRAKVVQSSHIPWGEIKDRIHRLKRSPLLLSELSLETYARFKNTKAAEMILSHRNVAVKPAGKILRRHLEIPKFTRAKNRLMGHKMATRGDARIQRDITKRVELLSKMESIANAAIDRKDFPLQVVALTVLAKEKSRLAKELKTTPAPSGLNATQLKQYQNILKQKIDGMTAEAIEIARTVDQSWKNEKYIDEKMSTRNETPLVMQELYANEAKLLLPYAPGSKKNSLIKLSRVSNESIKSLGKARRDVRQNPFSKDAVTKLREFEFMNNNQSHVAFLDQRLNELNNKVVP